MHKRVILLFEPDIIREISQNHVSKIELKKLKISKIEFKLKKWKKIFE